MEADELARTAEFIRGLLKILEDKGVKASEGDEDYTTIISWESVEKIEAALKGQPVVIRPGLGYAGGTIVYKK